ncbi:MAG: hypothetical protein AAF518_04725 [Spirochaetota bacterium]
MKLSQFYFTSVCLLLTIFTCKKEQTSRFRIQQDPLLAASIAYALKTENSDSLEHLDYRICKYRNIDGIFTIVDDENDLSVTYLNLCGKNPRSNITSVAVFPKKGKNHYQAILHHVVYGLNDITTNLLSGHSAGDFLEISRGYSCGHGCENSQKIFYLLEKDSIRKVFHEGEKYWQADACSGYKNTFSGPASKGSNEISSKVPIIKMNIEVRRDLDYGCGPASISDAEWEKYRLVTSEVIFEFREGKFQPKGKKLNYHKLAEVEKSW